MSQSIDTNDFVAAYDAYADAIYRHCYFRVFQKERAEELMQETFMKTWQYLRTGHSIENMRAFLYRVANNLIIDESRKKKESSLDQLMENGGDVGVDHREKLVDHLDTQVLLQLVDRLNDRYRTMILLRYVDELLPEEIAIITGDTPNAVSVCLHRALAQVRTMINEHSI